MAVSIVYDPRTRGPEVTMPHKPAPDEHASYVTQYIDPLPDRPVLGLLESAMAETCAFYAALSEDQGDHRYQPGKWSVKEVLGHVTDTERVFIYRALCFSRGEAQSLPGFEEGEYVAGARSARRTLESLVEEYAAVRTGTLSFLRGLDEDQWRRSGIANQSRFTVRAIPWVLAGHDRHHRLVVAERYLGEAG
jgi:hypothetical protein